MKYIIRLAEKSDLFGVSRHWLGDVMSVVKVIELVRSSNENWLDAVENLLEEPPRLEGISEAPT